MTEGEKLTYEYDTAEGPAGLKSVLESFYERTQTDPVFASRAHFILYQHGNQESVIKVDMTEEPCLFWYYDLLGRAITNPVRDVIAEFLWERCGESKRRRNMSYEKFKKELPHLEDNFKVNILPSLLKATMEGDPYSD